MQVLASLGQTILVSAYTHSSLDHILLKLHAAGVPLLRIGDASKTAAALRACTLREVTSRCGGGGPALTAELRRRRVVGVTALGVSSSALWRRNFDVCVLDEAGQVAEPVCLGPLLRARRWMLVGDHNQLEPLSTHTKAKERGYATTLFKRLCDAHPAAVAELRAQYRMAADVMAICNTLVYDGALRCADDGVASAALELPRLASLPPIPPAQPDAVSAWASSADGGAASPSASRGLGRVVDWLRVALSSRHRVVLLDTDAMPAPEVRHVAAGGNTRWRGVTRCAVVAQVRAAGAGGGLTNPAEASIVGALVCAALACGAQPAQIGVIAAYRAQLKEIDAAISRASDAPTSGDQPTTANAAAPSTSAARVGSLSAAARAVEVLTVDPSQVIGAT